MDNNITDGIWVAVEEYDLLVQSEERLRLLGKAFNEMSSYDFEKIAKVILAVDDSQRG